VTLATRLSAFFLATLAAVLVSFSSAVYLFQRWTLLREADDRLEAALRTLVASIEVEPDGVEWNPSEHRLAAPAVPASVAWRVTDDAGEEIDRSVDFDGPGLDPRSLGEGVTTIASSSGRPWRIARDRISIEEAKESEDSSPAAATEPDDTPEYPALVVTAALPLDEVHKSLNRLAAALAVVSLAVCAVAATCGRRIVRRGLRPVTMMASAATTMTAASGARLPVPETGDELAGLGRAFNGLLDRLGEALDRERRFTAEASHQLRTPVTAMLGHVDVTLRRDRSPEEYRRTLAEVRSQADRLRRIVESLLSLARSEGTLSEDRLEPIDLAAWLPGYVETWSAHPRAADLRAEVDAAAGVVVRTDPDLLGQLIDILVDNALKYGPAGTPVTVRAGSSGNAVLIDVIDAGRGITDAEAGDLFRPFHRGEAAVRSGVPGLGLGLSLARRIAERLGAEVTFDRPAGGGCRFRVVLREAGGSGVVPVATAS